VKIPCPQCGGEVQLHETTGFVRCPFCSASLVLDLTGVRPHMLYRPRHGPADVAPLLRRWCDAQGLPTPSSASAPHLTFQPFWRFASQGRPRLVPAWPALEARWADVPVPEGEQVVYDPAVAGAARVVEPSVAEAAARNRAFGAGAVSTAVGDLVHVPFYDVQATIGGGRLAISVEACSGRVYPERMPPAAGAPAARQVTALATAAVGFLAMFVLAILIPQAWLAAGAVALTAVVVYWTIMGGRGRSTS
jgi:hypothetical protein